MESFSGEVLQIKQTKKATNKHLTFFSDYFEDAFLFNRVVLDGLSLNGRWIRSALGDHKSDIRSLTE